MKLAGKAILRKENISKEYGKKNKGTEQEVQTTNEVLQVEQQEQQQDITCSFCKKRLSYAGTSIANCPYCGKFDPAV